MNLIGALVGGTIGALIGAAIWALISYFTNYEVGYVAWGIGALAGGGVAVGSRNEAGTAGGAIAVVLALLGIAGGKWGSIEMSFRSYLDPELMAIAAVADEVEAEREEAGRPSLAQRTQEADSIKDEYATDVWSEATARWNNLTSAQQEEAKQFPPAAHQDYMVSYIADSLVEEHQANGDALTWPPGHVADTAWRKPHYPQGIWTDAEKRWSAMSPEDQSNYRSKVIAAKTKEFSSSMAAFHAQASAQGFMASIGLFDVLWVILAVGTAFRLGSGATKANAAS